MGDIVYVDGTLVLDVNSTIFKYKELYYKYSAEIPEGAKIIKKEIETINDLNNSSSFFRTYYITGGFATKKRGCMRNYRSIDDAYNSACEELANLSSLIHSNFFTEDLLPIFYRQMYIGAIGALETYLSDTMISWVFSNRTRFDKYVESQKKESISLKDLLFSAAHIEDVVYIHIQNFLYHRLDDVRDLYTKNIGIKFPERVQMKDFILKRHDLVHRNGKDKDGNYITVAIEDVCSLIQAEEDFIDDLYRKIKVIQ